MQSENTQNQFQTINPQYLIVGSDMRDANQVDLFHLAAEIYKRKSIIFLISGVCVLISVAVALLIPPTYQVKTHLIEPHADKFQLLSAKSDLNISSADLFKQFIKTLSQKGNIISYLQAKTVDRSAIDQAKVASTKMALQQLNAEAKNYSVSVINHVKTDIKDNLRDNSREADLVTLSQTLDLEAKDSQNLINFTNQKVIQGLIQAQKAVVQNKILQLEDKMANDLAAAKAARMNEVKRLTDAQAIVVDTIKSQMEALRASDLKNRELRLEELDRALKIAQSMGIRGYIQSQDSRASSPVVENGQSNNDLYLKGTAYLEKEIALTKSSQQTPEYKRQVADLEQKLFLLQNDKKILALANRKDDRPYIADYEKNAAELNRLKSLTYDTTGVKSYELDGMPQIDTSPVKPNKRLIVLLGGILGLMLSVFIVIIQITLAARRDLIVN